MGGAWMGFGHIPDLGLLVCGLKAGRHLFDVGACVCISGIVDDHNLVPHTVRQALRHGALQGAEQWLFPV